LYYRVPALLNIGLNSDFKKEGPKQLIPVIFSHGMGSTRTMNSFMLCELASHGSMVFSIDHTDGSCAHFENEDGDFFYKSYLENNDFPKVR